MTFLEAVNQIFVDSAIIRGDTDTVATFDDIVHNASIRVARSAVRYELVQLIADRLIPKERLTTGSIALVNGTRVYDLASGFTRFYGVPHFYNSTQNRQIYEYPGGLEKLQIEIYNFASQSGAINWWYWEPSNQTLKQVGFFLVPGASESGEVWTYDYEGTVLVSASSDNLPFHNEEEALSFTGMASRRFKMMFEDVNNKADIQAVLNNDEGYKTQKATLYKLLRGQDAARFWGYVYR